MSKDQEETKQPEPEIAEGISAITTHTAGLVYESLIKVMPGAEIILYVLDKDTGAVGIASTLDEALSREVVKQAEINLVRR